MKRHRHFLLTVALAALTSPVIGSDEPQVHIDGIGDAVIRRTDLGNDGPLSPTTGLPDLVLIRLGGWTTPTPTTNPYAGSWIDARDTDLFRIDVVFDGVVNPPGPINLLGDGYDPFRYGDTPVYGYLELDIDEDKDTGGEIDNVRNRPLGNAARFGGTFAGSVGARAAVSGYDLDDDLCSGPSVERSGEEFHLSLCMCIPFTISTMGDPTPNSFDAGDTWLITGRLFRRTHAFQDFSVAFGGSEPGMYDPVVNLLWSHDLQSDQTTISLVWALENSGSRKLRGDSSTQGNDFNAGNQTSMLEALAEIRWAAQNNNGDSCSPYALLSEWKDGNHAELDEFLRAEQWDVLALFGTAYDTEQPDALYVWTDVGPDFKAGDCNYDGFVNATDVQFVQQAIGQADGTAFDADGVVNGRVMLENFSENFVLYDLNYDGYIGVEDLALIGYEKRGDVNSDGAVTTLDRTLLRSMLGLTEGHPQFNPAADLNGDGIINQKDDRLLFGILNLRGITPNP